jgi:hypothetical protein
VTRYLKNTRLLAGALALVVGLTLVAPPAFAAGPAPGPIAAAATAKVEAVPAEALAQAAAQATPAVKAPTAVPVETGHKSFFKTTTGAIALVLLAGTITYTGYSLSHDRIKSPAK